MENYRLTPEELGNINGFETVTDQEAELIIDDAVAFARMCIEVIDRD